MKLPGTHSLKRVRAAFLPLALLVLVGGMSGATIVLPISRSAEINENSPTKEHNEELTTAGRFDRYLRLGEHSAVVVFNLPDQPPLGHSQHRVLDSPRGHRLPNGLLAPLTC